MNSIYGNLDWLNAGSARFNTRDFFTAADIIDLYFVESDMKEIRPLTAAERNAQMYDGYHGSGGVSGDGNSNIPTGKQVI